MKPTRPHPLRARLPRALVLAGLLAVLAAPPLRAQSAVVPREESASTSRHDLDRARSLAGLVRRDRSSDAVAALERGREALAILEAADDPDPALRVDLLVDMAWATMVTGAYDEATDLASRAEATAEAVGYPRGRADALNTLGVVARRRGDAFTALDRFNEALALRTALDDSVGIAMAHNNLGFVYATDLGDFDLALEHHLEAMGIREGLGRPADLALSLNNIGVLYQGLGELDRARDYLERALELRRGHDIELRVASTLSNLGEVMLAQGDVGGALERFRTALAIREEAGERTSIAQSRLHIGQAMTRLGRPAEAQAALDAALAEADALGEIRSQVRVHQALGALEASLARWAPAQAHLATAIELAEGMGATHLVADSWERMADVREDAGDPAGALAAHRRFKAEADRVMDEDKARRMAALEARYQAERRLREIDALRHEQRVGDLELPGSGCGGTWWPSWPGACSCSRSSSSGVAPWWRAR